MQTGFMIDSVVDPEGPAVVRLRQAAALLAAAEAAQAQALLDLAGEAEWDETAEFDVVGTRPVRIGVDGTRLVDEHVPLEVAAALGMSATTAIWLIRDVLNLAARHPRLWQAVQTCRFPLWRARTITQLVAAAGLDGREAIRVDREIADAVGRVGWRRLLQRLRGAMLQVAPEKLRAQAERSRAERYVRLGALEDDPASSYLAGRLDTAAARDFDVLLDRLADGLAARGESGDRDGLRAQALGVMAADLDDAVGLLGPAGSPGGNGTKSRGRRKRREHRFYVHLPAVLTPDAVADVETLGPILADQLKGLVGDRPIRLTPVVRIGGNTEPVVDSYEIPESMREVVRVRDRYDVFPFGTCRARGCDLDHTIPFVEGAPGQTRPSNLGPQVRRGHRGKTHGGWRLEQPCPGVFWWTSPRNQVYRVGPDGTRNLTPGDKLADCGDVERRLLLQLDRWRGS